MKIEHVAIWAKDLELMKDFYAGNFGASVGARHTEESGFQSYFLTSPSGSRLEIMSRQDVRNHSLTEDVEKPGLAHLAFSVGSPEAVDEMTAKLVAEGRTLIRPPRPTPDGYYESCLLDPEGNPVEITA